MRGRHGRELRRTQRRDLGGAERGQPVRPERDERAGGQGLNLRARQRPELAAQRLQVRGVHRGDGRGGEGPHLGRVERGEVGGLQPRGLVGAQGRDLRRGELRELHSAEAVQVVGGQAADLGRRERTQLGAPQRLPLRRHQRCQLGGAQGLELRRAERADERGAPGDDAVRR